MKKTFLCFFFLLFLLQSYAQFRVSDNRRYLLKDDKPFLWLADTGWELFHRLNKQQAGQYLKRRSEQGFTVVQAVLLAELDGLHTPNTNGDLPLINDDPAKPNEAYFKHADYIIDKAAEYNIVIGLLPTWGDKLYKDKWGKGPEIFNPANAKQFGKWVSERYKNRKNIIWILGGDRNPLNEMHTTVWRNMAAGIIEGAGDSNKPLVTFHPQPNASGSAEWFHKDDWLSFNMFQTGHCRYGATYDKIQSVYNMQPLKPVLDGEPLYEDHPVCFNAKDYGTSNAYDVRQYAYFAIFAGALGHTYGCHDIWQFYSPYNEGINGPHIYWQDAMELPGANQMQLLKRLILSRPFLDRVPDQSLIVESNNFSAERIQATRGNDYAFIYTVAGSQFTVNPKKISGINLHAYWYNPRNGEVKDAEQMDNNKPKKYSPPTSGYGQDWVLVLDDATKKYARP